MKKTLTVYKDGQATKHNYPGILERFEGCLVFHPRAKEQLLFFDGMEDLNVPTRRDSAVRFNIINGYHTQLAPVPIRPGEKNIYLRHACASYTDGVKSVSFI